MSPQVRHKSCCLTTEPKPYLLVAVTVNVVSTFLLALLILPKLQETAQVYNIVPNLCVVSSELHFVTAVGELPGHSEISI